MGLFFRRQRRLERTSQSRQAQWCIESSQEYAFEECKVKRWSDGKGGGN